MRCAILALRKFLLGAQHIHGRFSQIGSHNYSEHLRDFTYIYVLVEFNSYNVLFAMHGFLIIDHVSQCLPAINTSGKNFIKITSVGMGAAKSNETRYIGMVMSVNSLNRRANIGRCTAFQNYIILRIASK